MRRSIYSNENKALTEWLVEQRQKAKLTQRELATLLDVHHSIVGKIETGERRLNVVEFVEYCLKLDADPHEVIDIVSGQVSMNS
ncbi:MAG: transcriptional regulator [Methylophaga sp.]|nr:MAG: transcriptional regulator [Methylophaga sp.]